MRGVGNVNKTKNSSATMAVKTFEIQKSKQSQNLYFSQNNCDAEKNYRFLTNFE